MPINLFFSLKATFMEEYAHGEPTVGLVKWSAINPTIYPLHLTKTFKIYNYQTFLCHHNLPSYYGHQS